MSRIRTFKPEMLEDEATSSLTDTAWRLFGSLILLADDYGNLRGSPNWISGQVFWAASKMVDVEGYLDELVRKNLIVRYEVRGQSYITIRSWKKHQRIDKPGKPRVPGPEEAPQKTVASDSQIIREKILESQPRLATEDEDDHDPEGDLDHDPEDDPVRVSQSRLRSALEKAGWHFDLSQVEIKRCAEISRAGPITTEELAYAVTQARERDVEAQKRTVYILGTIAGQRRDAKKPTPTRGAPTDGRVGYHPGSKDHAEGRYEL